MQVPLPRSGYPYAVAVAAAVLVAEDPCFFLKKKLDLPDLLVRYCITGISIRIRHHWFLILVPVLINRIFLILSGA
eukprot:SAG31_NODE_4945_length_2843_cov_1.830904_3_plen_76_part_00